MQPLDIEQEMFRSASMSLYVDTDTRMRARRIFAGFEISKVSRGMKL